MMAEFLFWCLVGLSALLLLGSLRSRADLLSFPVLFSGAFLFSIAPQLVNHVFYRGRLPNRVYEDSGVELSVLMCLLCLVAGVGGYYSGNKSAPSLIPRQYDLEKLFWAGFGLCAVGTLGAFQLAQLAGGFLAQFTAGGHYDLEWSGASVIWAYVAKMLPIGLMFCLFSAMSRGSLLKWGLCLLMFAYPLAVIIFLGRRSMIFRIALILLSALWFRKKWAPPRWSVPAGMAVGAMLIILIPYYRGYANRTGDVKTALAQVDVATAIQAYMAGEKAEGMDNLIMGIPARLNSLSFALGSGFWNETVDFLVPGSLIGPQVKAGMKLDLADPDEQVFSRYCGEGFEYGSFCTGPYSVFYEFWFLGACVYWFMGRAFRRLWIRANQPEGWGAQLIYASCALLVPMSVVNSATVAFSMCVFLLAIQLPLLALASKPSTAAETPPQL